MRETSRDRNTKPQIFWFAERVDTDGTERRVCGRHAHQTSEELRASLSRVLQVSHHCWGWVTKICMCEIEGKIPAIIKTRYVSKQKNIEIPGKEPWLTEAFCLRNVKPISAISGLYNSSRCCAG